jgi:hypothetical protein
MDVLEAKGKHVLLVWDRQHNRALTDDEGATSSSEKEAR